MPAKTTIDILKEAILLERRGRAFYGKVADQSENPDVKEFFETMAREEVQHVEILENQFAAYVQNQQFTPVAPQKDADTAMAQLVLTREVKQKIAAADFEAAAISAAMLMEEKAIDLYTKRAESAQDAQEATLYKWLADWERSHLSFLAQLDKEIRETVWNDNQFWPY
jgi:rubrerythrin